MRWKFWTREIFATFLLILCFARCEEDQKSFQNYKVLRTKQIEDDETVATLLTYDGLEDVQFWKYPSVNGTADIMIAPHKEKEIENTLNEIKLGYITMVNNVEELIEEERKESVDTFDGESTRNYGMTWNRYHRYDVIKNFMKNHGLRNAMVSYESLGTSSEGREIPLVKISTGGSSNKPAVWIDGGMHAREWISPATVTYMMNKLVNDDQYKDLLDMYDWYIAPLINVDGYEYTHTRNRMWRKTRSRNPRRPSCPGVDPNRNFGFHWGQSGSSSNPCSDVYKGSRAFSEPETTALARKLKQIGSQLKIYLTFHSYSQLWLVPWSYASYPKPADYSQLMQAARVGSSALGRSYGTRYRVGSAPDILYAASGGSDDYAKSLGIKYSYTLELRDTGRYGFSLPSNQILQSGEETLRGVAAIVKHVHKTL